MAGLGNTGINGFLASAIQTGAKILKKGKAIPEFIEHFLSGFAGYGWKIWEHREGKYKLEIDNITVRDSMTVFELLVHKIRAIIGALAITQGQGKIKSVSISPDQTEYLIEVEEDMSFMADDFIRCQTWTGSVKMYHVKVDRITDNKVIHIPIEEFEGYSLPQVGDEIIQFGNKTNLARQSAIYIHADEDGQPAIDVMFGINSKDWSRNVKIRLGGEIPDSGGAKGLYVENGMIKGTNEAGHTVYCIYPNGNAMFGDGSAMFNSDKSGQLAGGAIRWHMNDITGNYELILGDNVILTWDNLSGDAKDELKPFIGGNGNWWVGGVDTGQKAQGEDANLLPWVDDWNNNRTKFGNEYVVSPKMFSGTRSTDGKLTGVAMGRDSIVIDGLSRTGIFAIDNDKVVVEIDPINRSYKFTGKVESNHDGDKIVIDPSKRAIEFEDSNGRTRAFIGFNGLVDPILSLGDISAGGQPSNIRITPFYCEIMNTSGAITTLSQGLISMRQKASEAPKFEVRLDSSGNLLVWMDNLFGNLGGSKGSLYVDSNNFLKINK